METITGSRIFDILGCVYTVFEILVHRNLGYMEAYNDGELVLAGLG